MMKIYLQPSGYLSVASVRVGTPASFESTIIQNNENLTLEDLFTLMHQNILASTVILGKDLQITSDLLPDKMREVISGLEIFSILICLRYPTSIPASWRSIIFHYRITAPNWLLITIPVHNCSRYAGVLLDITME